MKVLHPVKSLDTVMPAYAQAFQCIGPSCTDNCCTGWTVSIDRKTHQCYQRVAHPDLTPKLQTVLHRTRSTNSDSSYARVEMKTETGECPFMADRLCAIQGNLGEDKLSDTCFSYPRDTSELAGVRQQSLTLSCPEAARLALSEPGAMAFVRAPVTVRPSTVVKKPGRWGLSNETINGVRFFAIQLVQSEAMPLWERLAIVGFLCELLDSMVQAGRQDDVEAALGHLDTAVKSGESSKALAELLPDHPLQAILFAKLWGARTAGQFSDTQKRVRDQIVKGLGFDITTGYADNETVVTRYQEGLEHLREVNQSFPWALSHYISNEMFREGFPFGGKTALNHYTQLIVRYGMVRLMLAARCREAGRPLQLTEVAETIQVFARIYQHNTKFAQGVDDCLKAADWTTLDKTYRFLRN